MDLPCLGLLVVIVYGTSFALAGKWGNWRAISACDAKPCNCFVAESEKKPCDNGQWTQIRSCIPDEDGPACQYELVKKQEKQEKQGVIRKTLCTNNACPGWSDWELVGPCDCSAGNSVTTAPNDTNWVRVGIQKLVKHCNNPPPSHDIQCDHEGFPNLKVEQEELCNCTDDETTTAEEVQTTVTTTLKPCCPEVTTMSAYYLDSNDTAIQNYSNGNNATGEDAFDFDDTVEEEEEGNGNDPSWNYYDNIATDSGEMDCVPCPIVRENVTESPLSSETTMENSDLL